MRGSRCSSSVRGALAAILLVLAGCGTSGGSSGSKQLTIAFIPGIASDPFFKAMEIGARAEAQALGIKLIWQGSSSDYSPQTEIPFVDSALAQKVGALILVPTDPDALQASVTKARALKIPVITVDTTVSDQSYLTAHITGDNIDGGAQAAKTLAEQIGGKGKVYIQSGSPGATTNTLREQGFRDELKAHYPNVTIVGREYSNSQPAAATSAINTILLKEPDLAGIFAIDGTSGTGAIAALQNSGKAGKVKLIGYDAYHAQVEALKAGVFSALIAQRPGDEAKLALDDAVAKITGKGADQIQKKVVIANIVMTKDNLATTGKYEYAQ